MYKQTKEQHTTNQNRKNLWLVKQHIQSQKTYDYTKQQINNNNIIIKLIIIIPTYLEGRSSDYPC